jgi:hypothetical protein
LLPMALTPIRRSRTVGPNDGPVQGSHHQKAEKKRGIEKNISHHSSSKALAILLSISPGRGSPDALSMACT